MRVTKTVEGWELIPECKDEQSRLEWLVESIKPHPDQQTAEAGSISD